MASRLYLRHEDRQAVQAIERIRPLSMKGPDIGATARQRSG